MDFIKTSSLRALIELTFQRNWNGIIWMSRKGVITKRVRLSRRLYRETAPNRAVRLAEERCSALGQIIRPTEVSAKVQTTGRSRNDPGNIVPRSAKPNAHATPRTTKAREPGKRPRGRATVRVPRPMHPSDREERPTSGREHRPNLHPSTTPADRESVRPRPFRLGHDPTVRPIVPTDRPNAAVDPKPFLKPKLMFSSPA
ncbi:unnamed protein product [Microthlaspi erraticum]|uniref:Uncharacterized protein n=1 Tax=Microthlaspi erraticum TaxID=1685480 RepID=A0A6D2HDV2_9BRAS|nr:unnamed protein product [Microthlaspi erraticum]